MQKEMTKLREGLDNAGIAWYDESDARFGMFIYRTKFTNKHGDNCSVICGVGLKERKETRCIGLDI